MSDPAYLAPLGRIFEYFAEGFRTHIVWVRNSGILGPEPTENLLMASVLEVGCAHLYLLDHELRHGRREDEVLNGFWREIAGWLAVPYLQSYDQKLFGTILGWRIGRYEDVTAHIEEDETYGYRDEAKREDYFFVIAQQLALCLAADANFADEFGLYFGIVDGEKIQHSYERSYVDAIASLQRSLLEHVLPLYFAAQLWSRDSAAYEKSVKEIEALFEEGKALAEESLHQRTEGRRLLWSSLRWAEWYKEGTRFRPAQENPFEYGEIGEPYQRVEPDPTGLPLGWLLLQAYDQINGLVAVADAERGLDAHLTLGRLQQMLLTGSPYDESMGDDMPDASQPEQLSILPPSPWQLSAGSRFFIQQVMARVERETRLSWLRDAQGNEALLLAHVAEKGLLAHLQLGTPTSILLAGEWEPNLARFSANDIGDEGEKREAQTVLPDYPNAEWRERINAGEVHFRLVPLCLYGPVGEPYQVLEAVPAPDEEEDEDESAGKPLLRYALGCYDLSYGMLLRASAPDPHGAEQVPYVWTITLGELVFFLRNGELRERPTPSQEELVRRSLPAEGAEPMSPDFLALPGRIRAGIAWAMERIGIKTPAACAVRTQTGEQVLFFAYGGLSEQENEWLFGRISWYLPPDTLARFMGPKNAAFVEQFPLQET